MAAVNIHSDFGAQKKLFVTVSTVSPSICHEVMGPDAMILIFLTTVGFYTVLGNKRPAARGTASQIVLKYCSKEVGRKDSIYVILVKGEYMQSRIHFLIESSSWSHETSSSHEKRIITTKDFSSFLLMRDIKIGLIQSAPENIYLKTCPASLPRAKTASFLLSTLDSFYAVVKFCNCSSTWFNPYRGGWQVLMANDNLWLTTFLYISLLTCHAKII